jgi:protein-L-isoaspartate(D-aspartate) O-methyltransferase
MGITMPIPPPLRSESASQRAEMVERQIRARGITAPRVLEAFAAVPREAFVPADHAGAAYEDRPLPIGEDQTISQPFVVALTVAALQLEGHECVLEIGTGSGYAAAILGSLAREVHTVERIPSLAATAKARLAALGITNVHVHCADGTLGWPAAAPYEAIAVAAGAPRPPPALLHQLALGGRLVVPHGSTDEQHLARLTRTGVDSFTERDLGEVRFVPLLGAEGWPLPPLPAVTPASKG